MIKTSSLATLAFAMTATATTGGEIDLTMTGFASDDGMARIVLMDGPEEFAGLRPVRLVASVPIANGEARWSETVPEGTYSIIAHHDRNGNDAFDRPVFGLPVEPYGYSNGAWTSAGLPEFAAVAFRVGQGTAPQHIHMRLNAFVTLAQIAAAGAVALAALLAFVALRHRRRTRLV